MKILRRSGWTFDTSAGGGIGYGSFTVEGGVFALRDLEGASHQYSFSAFGTSISRSLTGFFIFQNLRFRSSSSRGKSLEALDQLPTSIAMASYF